MAKVKGRKRRIIFGVVFVLLFVGLLAFTFSGDNRQILIDAFVKDIPKEELHDHLSQFGWKGYITIGILSMLQVIFTFVPAEPVQVLAGISFGLWKGVLCCTAGVFLGNTLIFVLYKLYGNKLTEYFDKKLEIDFEKASKSKRVALIILIMYFLPAIPYGLICFFSATLGMKYHRYMFITVLGSIPSIFIGVGLGHIAIASSWILAVCVFAVLVVILAIMTKHRKALFAKVNAFMDKKKEPYSSVTKAQVPKRWFVKLIYFFACFHFKPKMKVKLTRLVEGEIERPSIILINHGSFVDFFYTGMLLKNEGANFISNRMYFYKKFFGKNMAKVGCFPKSMFQNDMENAKNIVRVLARKGVLAFMPEARLSTAGKFEGIQDATYKFIKRAGVPVYIFKLHGDYLARPKWGDAIRKGSLVECEFYRLYTADEIKEATIEEVTEKVTSALYYDEFEWLKTKPKLRYKSKTLAVGLENILTRCPECGERYSFTTSGRTITCSHCGLSATMDDRYGFIDNKPFENLSKWYDWQESEWAKEIENPDFRLESEVKLKHASFDGKTMLRDAGEGRVVFSAQGLTYYGVEDGEEIEKFFPMKNIYRLLFGAGEDFEVYDGEQIWYFIPSERRCCVDWYTVSGLLRDRYEREEKNENN